MGCLDLKLVQKLKTNHDLLGELPGDLTLHLVHVPVHHLVTLVNHLATLVNQQTLIGWKSHDQIRLKW